MMVECNECNGSVSFAAGFEARKGAASLARDSSRTLHPVNMDQGM